MMSVQGLPPQDVQRGTMQPPAQGGAQPSVATASPARALRQTGFNRL